MRVDFTKMHGVGNDFAIFEAAEVRSRLTPDRVRQLADRRTGIGFDQALLLGAPHRPGSAASYRIFNRDGDEVEQCGNGARCIAALLFGRRGGEHIALDSPAGTVRARPGAPGQVAIDMGPPNFEPRALPFDAAAARDPQLLEVGGQMLRIGVVSLGNPHAVLEVADVDSAPVASLGPLIEQHPRFPRRVNVGFLQILDEGHVRLRVHERGAGETPACGTGACAAVVIGQRRGQLAPRVLVSVPGGTLQVDWAGEPTSVWLTGPAKVSFEGHVEV